MSAELLPYYNAELDDLRPRCRPKLGRNLPGVPVTQVSFDGFDPRLVSSAAKLFLKFQHSLANQRQAARGDKVGAGRDRQLKLGLEVLLVAFPAERYTHASADRDKMPVVPARALLNGASGAAVRSG